jgi:hypothetical protein
LVMMTFTSLPPLPAEAVVLEPELAVVVAVVSLEPLFPQAVTTPESATKITATAATIAALLEPVDRNKDLISADLQSCSPTRTSTPDGRPMLPVGP